MENKCPTCKGEGVYPGDRINPYGIKCLKCKDTGTIKKEPTVSKEEAERHRIEPEQKFDWNENMRLLNESTKRIEAKLFDKESIRRETATQIFCALIASGQIKWNEFSNSDRGPVLMIKATLGFTDLLLKKLGE